MRNLKRALSLALAFVMVMGLMIVGTSAKSYTDADKIDNQVAVEILGELGVMIGNDDGSFAPDRDVTRAEMAVLITRILYGNNLNVDQFKDMNTFTDVPDWAEGFVNLCASLDIIAGRGNGIFDPDATVTSAEAALMLSRALGYFKNNAEFGNDWALAAMKRATQIGIIGGDMVLQANAGLDRDDVAQMTFNTLTKAVPVQYNELLDVYYNVNQGVIYALEFNYLQTLGYTNFNLVYKSNQTVEYGRPATTWGIGSYKDAGNGTASGIEKADLTPAGGLIADNVRMLAKDEIITVNNTPVYVYDNGTKEKDVYADLGADVCTQLNWWNKDGYEWTAFVNGKEQKIADIPSKNDTSKYAYTDKGSVTEIYVDDYAATVTVVEINYFLGQVSKVDENETTVRPLSQEGKILDDKTFATSEFKKGDYVVFTVDFNDDNDYYICEMMAPETVTGEVTRVQNDKDSKETYVRLNGEDDQYYYTAKPTHVVYDVSKYDDNVKEQHPDLGEEYVFYMTPAGYILGFQLANKVESQYLYVENSDEELRNWTAAVILPDATEPEVEVDRDLGNTAEDIHWIPGFKVSNIDTWIWDYTVDSDGVYSLSYVAHKNEVKDINKDEYQSTLKGVEINNGEAYIKGVNKDSDFIIDKDTIFVDTMNHKAYTGYNEVPNVENAKIAYVVDDGVAQIVYILNGTIYDENSIYFMLTTTDRDSFKYDGDYYYAFDDSYVDGKNQPLNISYDAVKALMGNKMLETGVLYQAVKSLEDGKYITEIRFAGPETNDVIGVGNDSFRISTSPDGTTINKEKFDVDDETVFVLVEYLYTYNPWRGYVFDGYEISKGDIDDLFVGTNKDGYNIYVDVVERDGQNADLVYMTYRKAITEYVVTVKTDANTIVTIDGKTYENGDQFTVQTGTKLNVVATAKDGYKLVKDPTGTVVVDSASKTVIEASSELEKVQINLTGKYTEQVTMTPEKPIISAEDAAKVTLKANAGYTIKAVKTNNPTITATEVDGNEWTVDIPAGAYDKVVLELTIVPDVYSFTQKDNDFTYTVTQNGQKVSTLTIGETYTVSVQANKTGAWFNGMTLKADGQKVNRDVKTAGGVTLESRPATFNQAVGILGNKGVVYTDKDCTQAINKWEDLVSSGLKTFYYVQTAGELATASYTFTVAYSADQTIDFNMVW